MPYMTDAEFAEKFLATMAQMGEESITYKFTVESGTTGKPRASSIAGCAAQQWYALSGADKTSGVSDKNYSFAEDNWPAWMGFAGQELAAEVLRRMGYDISTPDIFGDCATCNHPVQTEDECVLCECSTHVALMTGHVDGFITGVDLDVPHIWDSKVRNAFGYQKLLLADSVKAADAQMYGQMQMYMRFLDVERTMITVHPHDSSTTRNNLTRRKEPIPFETIVVFRKFIEADADDQSLLMERGMGLTTALALDIPVEREFNPDEDYFPCGWCPWKQRCMVDHMQDRETIQLPPIPEGWGR